MLPPSTVVSQFVFIFQYLCFCYGSVFVSRGLQIWIFFSAILQESAISEIVEIEFEYDLLENNDDILETYC